MDGPYRELDHGFARLSGREGFRRAPSRITCVEDALFELLRNSRDAGARNVYVASTLRRRRYRVLTVIDDGEGVPGTYTDRVFEPGVTTRHLSPRAPRADEPAHGSGLSLYHLRELSESAELLSSSNPTSIRVAFDTTKLPETSLQSHARPSHSNIPATLEAFATAPDAPTTYYASPSRILSTLLQNHIILSDVKRDPGSKSLGGPMTSGIGGQAEALGIKVSERTVQRVLRGSVGPARPVEARRSAEKGLFRSEREREGDGPGLVLSTEELAAVDRIIQSAARSRYMEASRVTESSQFSGPGRLCIEVALYFPEDEYE